MKNKKGFLLTEETLKIVVAVIGLVILAYFLVSLYYSNLDQERKRQATSVVERIKEVSNGLSESQWQNELLQPKGWTVFGFVGDGELKPNSCFGENCLCICDEVLWEGFDGDRQIKECSNNGVCTVIENLESFEEFEISSYGDGLTIANISLQDGKIIIEEIK